MHFTADDVASFVTLTNGTATGATGTYRVKTFTDGQTLELDGLAPTGAGTVDWVLEPDLKAITSSSNHADSTDTTGVPIADSGAYDETTYDATFVDVIDPLTNGGIVEEDGDRIFGRSFGAEKDPNATVAPDGVRFYVQLLTGANTGAAVASLLESISGKSGSAASLTNASTTITGLSGMQSEDVGKYITIYNTAVDGNQRFAKITVFNSATSVDVAGANFATDANDGSIKWAVSRHVGNYDMYYGLRERMDQAPSTRRRGKLIGGIVSDAELTLDVSEIRDSMGISDGVSDLSGLLTNQVAEYVFGDLPDANPSVVEALNTLNTQIGDRNYTGTILTDGETIAASLQAVADAIAGADFVRTIERLVADIDPGTAHTLPGAQSYTLDGTNNGQNLTLFWRKQLRDPGPATTGSNDYEETSTTSFTPYEKIKSGDSINYYLYA